VEPKPKGWGPQYAAAFEERSVAARYGLRPPYPPGTFELLAALAPGERRAVLDAGCGPGDLARGLAPLVDHVDAVDRSPAMIEAARARPAPPNVRWIEEDVEDAELDPPYALVVAGDSIHWFDWERALPRFAEILTPAGVLAILSRDWSGPETLRQRRREVYARHATNRDFKPLDPVDELERRGLFDVLGRHVTESAEWTPTLDELLGCHHSQSSFVLERMTDPDGFDRELGAALEELAPRSGERFRLTVRAMISWGRPRG
jgi:SAM-dependent methyltransferase